MSEQPQQSQHTSNSTKSQALHPPTVLERGKVQYIVQGQKFEVNKKYNVTKVVGCGAYGTVCAAINTSTKKGDKVAIKKIARVFDDLVDCKRILREIKVLAMVRHSNLIRLHEFLRPLHKHTFEDVYVVTDLYDSALHRIIKSQQPLTDEHLQYFLVQAFRGLNYLHSANIIHRDLKPSNLLVNANCDLTICDFGLARGADKGELTEYVVTRWYRPPELLALSSNYDTAVDVWSMGLIFAEMLFGRTVLPGKDYIAQLTLVMDLLGTPTDEDMECLSDQAKKFIRAQPKKQPRDFRVVFPKATDNGVDLLRKLLQFHPAKRLKSMEILEHPYFSKFRDPAEEAVSSTKFTWNAEPIEMTEVELRSAIWDEIVKRSEENVESSPVSATKSPTTTNVSDNDNKLKNEPAKTVGGESSNRKDDALDADGKPKGESKGDKKRTEEKGESVPPAPKEGSVGAA